jgi:hypothetical protein
MGSETPHFIWWYGAGKCRTLDGGAFGSKT